MGSRRRASHSYTEVPAGVARTSFEAFWNPSITGIARSKVPRLAQQAQARQRPQRSGEDAKGFNG